MESAHRWRPPLPSLGRLGGAPVAIPMGMTDFSQRLKFYLTERRSVADFFEVRIQPYVLERCGLGRAPGFLNEFEPHEQCHLILSSLYYKASTNFKMKLRMALQRRGGLTRVRQWFHTANGVVIPFLLTHGEDYEWIDRLTRWTLENCANNYAHFQADLKCLKKQIRKDFALNRSSPVKRSMRTYSSAFRLRTEFDSPQDMGRYYLLWSQTRAVGLADGVMVARSVEKFISTVTTPSKGVRMDPSVLHDCVVGAIGVDGKHARLSVGVTACLESTRQEGGKSAFLSRLSRTKSVVEVYNLDTLESRPIQARPVRSSEDVVQWAVRQAIRFRTHTKCVRLHTVVEPGKARTITVAPYAYQVLMGVFAHVFQATLKSRGVQSGLTRDRHLWRFLSDTMNPSSLAWGDLQSGQPVWGLSTDWSEATDYGDPKLARQVWMAFIALARAHPGFPTGLALLAMNLYCEPRYVFVPWRGGYRLVTTRRGWFMGDMMTKVILTVVHDYTMRIAGLTVYSLVGDDEVVLSNDRQRLARHLELTELLDVKVSREDTFISRRLIYYCEEGALVPQAPHHSLYVSMKRGDDVGYLDYPRIRLLLAQSLETDNYSSTNIGRFALLGKESKWVWSVAKPAWPVFEKASLLQHVLVPQDADTLCPFTPIEIGGDGAYTNDPAFLRKVVDDKSRDPRETLYRMSALMENAFSYRFVRSDRYNEVVHKHHLLLPALEAIRPYLPDAAILEPKSQNERLLIESVRVRGIEKPSQTWLRLCRGFYWKEVFSGREPLRPTFDIQRSWGAGRTEDPFVDYSRFLEQWANPGFRFANHEPYFVLKDEVDVVDPLNLGWRWSDLDLLRYPSAYHVFNTWLADQDWSRSLDDIVRLVREGKQLPDRVQKRLHLFMESDNWILSTLPKEPQDDYYLVTRDMRLCNDVSRLLSTREKTCWVYAIDPTIYLTGKFCELQSTTDCPAPRMDAELREDPGALAFVDSTEFTDGFPHDEGIWDAQVVCTRHRKFRGVAVIHTARSN